MADDYGDKTEAPTLRRRQEARRDGRIARSADLTAALILLAGLLLVQTTGPRLVASLKTLIASLLAQNLADLSPAALLRPMKDVGSAMLPILIGLFVAAIVCQLLQAGFFFRFKLHADRLDPSKNVEQMFSGRSLVQLLMGGAKIALVGCVVYAIAKGLVPKVAAMSALAPDEMISAGGNVVASLMLRITLLLIALGVIDFFYQRWQHERDLRMTRREVLDELRQMEGDAAVKRRRRDLAAAATRKGALE